MAEFKLGRIKFVWKGTWAATTSYVVDDVVNNGGKSYICVINHTASAQFVTDKSAIPTKWELVSDGQTWRGNWAPSTYYNLGDLVKYGGIVYTCKTVHTSGTNVSPTYLGLEADQNKWDTFATSYNWTGSWVTNTKYRLNDFVQYGGVTYICTTPHISAATSTLGLEADIGNWEVFNEGISYLGTWSSSSVRYKLNDVVKYGANLWICVTDHTSSATFDIAKFDIFVNGLQFEDNWSNATTYQIGDVVTYGGYAYIAKQNHTNQIPSTAALYWDLFTTGFSFKGDWSGSNTYKPGDVVRRGGYTYISILDGINQAPPNATYWQVLNGGMKFISTSGTYNGVSGTNIGAGGTSATFNVVRSNTVYAVTLPGATTGSGYSIGNQIKILGSNLGGISPANDLIITVTSVSGGAINGLSFSGISVTWTSGNTYLLGDVVLWGVSSYLCVSAHVAITGNRPDNDTTGSVWNLLAGGTEQSVLTTQGDMFYYGPTGPTRLPIGVDGQVLRVKNGFPDWEFYGLINNIVYVSPTGEDGPASLGYGQSIDKPWNSVRFACQQIENGYLNKNAQTLIAKNKQFLMKEISNWVQYTYTVNVTSINVANSSFVVASTATLSANMPISFTGTAGGITAGTTYYIKAILSSTEFSISNSLVNGVASTTRALSGSGTNVGSLVYDAVKCQRDVGLIVDAVAFDISHGGNSKTVEAAMSYYTAAGNAYITTNFGQQAIQTAAAYTYLTTLLGNVLANTAPSLNYQTLNSVAVTANQIIDTSLTAETGSTSLVGTLVNIITNGILAKTSTAVPAPTYPNTTISVKTGTYFEILPMVLPSYTAVVGDELRSTVIQPATAIAALATDTDKTISALERIKFVIPTLVANSTVTPTSGNSATQVTTLPAGSTGSTAAIASVVTVSEIMYDIINNGISEAPAFVLPTLTGYNNSFLAGYGDGKAQIVQNYAFIKAEISAYLNVNFNAVWTALGAGGQANCQRDVGYLLDALQFDMTYGGNIQTLIAGSAYYSFSNLTIASTEKTATVAAYTRLKAIIGDIARKVSVTPTAGNAVTQVTGGTAGSAGSGTFAQARSQDIIDWINNGVAPSTVAPTAGLALADTGRKAAYDALQASKAEIQADAVVWVKKYFQNLNFDTAVCSRDAGLIVDAISFDTAFGSNLNSIIAGRSYWRALTSTAIVRTLQKDAELGAVNFIKHKAKAIAGAGASAQAVNVINDIIGTIKGGAVPRYTWPDYTGVDAEDAAAAKLLWINKEFIKAETIAYITATYPSAVYKSDITNRNVGYIVDALRYDLTYGGNYASRQMGLSYFIGSTLFIESGLSSVQILATFANLKTIVQDIANGGLSAYTPLQVGVTYISGTAGDSTSSTNVGTLVEVIRTTISNGNGTAPSETLPGTGWVATELTNANSALASARTTIRTSVITYITSNFPALTYDSTAFSTNVGYIIDTIGYDAMFAANYRSIVNGISYYGNQSSLISTSDKKVAAIAALNYLKIQIETTLAIYPTALASAKKNMQVIINILDKGTTEATEVNGTITYNNTLGTIKGAEIIRANKTFLATEATAWITNRYSATTASITSNVITLTGNHNFVVGDRLVFSASGAFPAVGGITFGTVYYVASVPGTATITLKDVNGTAVTLTDATGAMLVRYDYIIADCQRDMTEYVDAIVSDLMFVGNYKGFRAAQLYRNAVLGSKAENMFLVANGSGLRNCTLSGLEGTLTNPNSFNTKRPTAGSYVALNPGFGPNDKSAWVLSRSHYSQNVTMFGTGCSGAKIDAALHAGGNKSMVKNDFTTIISDGIGVWCTGSGSLTELVSVFNYYGYAGYLAELGGKIRATNGNSSYGTYGVIAEGVDTYEVPKYGTVDNRYNEAQVGLTITDATTEVLRLEYSNAGTNYTNNSPVINGSGYNALAVGDEFRDGALFEARIIDKNDGNGVGGTSYASFANAAQSSIIGEITLAATDTTLTDGYNGMRVQITAGTGAGQFANILSFLNGSKVAKIYKDSFTTLTVTATTAGGNNLLTVASTATLYVGMPIYLGADIGGLTKNTLYYVIAANFSATQFAVSTTSGGSAATTTLTSAQTVSLYAAGWDHVIAGKPVNNIPDLTSAYIVEPRVSYSLPGYTGTARTMASTIAWEDVAYGAGKYVAVGATTVSNYSNDGITWASAGALASSSTWGSVVYGGGEGAVAIAIVGGLGGTGATFSVTLGEANTTGAALSDQVKSVTVLTGGQNYTTPPTIVFTGTGSGAKATCTVLNGKVISVSVTNFGSGYTAAPTATAATDRLTGVTINSWGRNYNSAPTITFGYPAGLTPTAWIALTSVTSGAYLVTTDGNIYQVTNSGTTATTKPVHTSGSASDGSATLLWVAAQAVATANMTNNGVSSVTFTNFGSGYTSTPAVSIVDPAAKFVAISRVSAATCYQTALGLGGTWTAGTTTTGKTNLTGLAYGGGIYVGVGGTTGTASAVSSTDGSTWIDRSSAITALTNGNYAGVAFGGNVFVAVSAGTGLTTSYSTNGVVWTKGGDLPIGFISAVSIAYGNGRFVVLGTDGKIAYSYDKGVSWIQAPTCSGTTTSILSSSLTWNKIRYGQGTFFAIATGTIAATSRYGINWTLRTMPGSSTSWKAVAFGNPSSKPLWVAISNTSGTIAGSIRTGAGALGRIKVATGVVTETRLVEPGSGYPVGTVTGATGGATDAILTSDTTNLVDSQPVEFTGCTAAGLVENITYYVIGATIVANTSFKVSAVAGSSTPVDLTTASGLTGTYRAGPIWTITDPNKVKAVALRMRMGDGALGSPSFTNRGLDNATATSVITGDGYGDLYQASTFLNVANLFTIPIPGANVEFASLPGVYFKLVSVTNVLGVAGNYTAQLQINPGLTTLQAPTHGDIITTRLAYSQVRLTGHDFLYIGTGNKTKTNYPYVDPTSASQANQANSSGGGRVFFTSTDQDGNFNVGNLFGVQQATGTATLNASAFNLSGLNSLQLGAVSIGVGSAVITQFSTDPYFTANSDNIVPTQRAIKAYITAQIGGGSSSLNVNTLTSGVIYVANNTISTTSGQQINVTSKMNFTGGIDGAPVALGFFMQR